ncbi:MAG: hypothetical protein Q9191_006113 [Dirinaria sp. TL-2023a]
MSMLVKLPWDPFEKLMELDIDATMLRTCQKIYQEALPILYGENTFHVFDPHEIQSFQGYGLADFWTEVNADPSLVRYDLRPVRFNFNFVPGGNAQGRLSLIRKLSIGLVSYRPSSKGLRIFSNNTRPTKLEISDMWTAFLLNESHVPLRLNSIFLPSLEELKLDFSDWNLGEDHRLQVDPIIKKFRGSIGLRRLEIIELKNADTKQKIRQGLLSKTGAFEAREWRKLDNDEWHCLKVEENPSK